MFLQLLALMSLAALAGTGDGAKATTHLRFYLHDIVTALPGQPATAVRIAKATAPLPGNPTIPFGDMFVIDDPLTEGPNAASPAVGRAQGFYLVASQTEIALMLIFNAVFTAGPHNGSTVAVVSRDLITAKVRELPVVGGTGVFRGATGYALFRTHTFNTSDMNAVLKVDICMRCVS
ncbi:hypothetical protein EJB05_28368, partial [Eragrostis curvula]